MEGHTSLAGIASSYGEGKEDHKFFWEGVSMAWKALRLLPERMPGPAQGKN